MATIYIDNIIKRQLLNLPGTPLYKEPKKSNFIFADLHLDLVTTTPKDSVKAVSNDLMVDYDDAAIRNSLFNIFTTRQGSRYLDPTFGASFETFLFERVNKTNARALGELIRHSVSTYEPRIRIDKIQVQTLEDESSYLVYFYYTLINGNLSKNFNITFSADKIEIV